MTHELYDSFWFIFLRTIHKPIIYNIVLSVLFSWRNPLYLARSWARAFFPSVSGLSYGWGVSQNHIKEKECRIRASEQLTHTWVWEVVWWSISRQVEPLLKITTGYPPTQFRSKTYFAHATHEAAKSLLMTFESFDAIVVRYPNSTYTVTSFCVSTPAMEKIVITGAQRRKIWVGLYEALKPPGVTRLLAVPQTSFPHALESDTQLQLTKSADFVYALSLVFDRFIV